MDPAPKPGPDEVVTLVVKHLIKQGRETDYEAWLRRIVRIAGDRPGHLGVDVVRGKQGKLALFTCILRYRSTDDLETWLDSSERKTLIAEAAPMLADGDKTEIGAVNEFWFNPETENTPKPPRWKQAVVTLFVILPLTLLVPIIWGPVLRLHPFLSNYVVATFLVTVTIVVLVVYLLMPAATRLFAPWLEASVKETL
ncbi:antibiotic biosynthesis monooxygenase [Pseudomonas tritici]|uniref:antibiotic biosynthesis monooxygenase n=1 Tax=Pseudomonas tritici TaxID=2745518 RepID=UPI00387AE551